jgi:hypothetical protein
MDSSQDGSLTLNYAIFRTSLKEYSMPLLNYTRVRFVTNRYTNEGVPIGTTGYIVEVFGDKHYEVEVSNIDGTTVALLTVEVNEVEADD